MLTTTVELHYCLLLLNFFFATLSKRLYEWAELYAIIPEKQFGFRPNYRAIDAIFILNALVERAFIKRQNLYCCFIDFKKAFDSVHHQLLWYKLSTIGVSTNCLRLLMNIYANAQSCIHLIGKYTDSFLCSIGVREGCPLSPILFTLFTHDLLDEIRKLS